MKDFSEIKFQGTFRVYQQKVLDNVDAHMADGRIHIVAAPGSGKTVLGLELIRRQNAPCIILSPTTAIRQQWGERFKELFLAPGQDFDALFSHDLHTVKLLNSVTYQALYTAIEKKSDDDGDEDCSDLDIFKLMRAYGVKTICLDEAHHLKNEWQKALEKFIKALDSNITVISLTATPPYDSGADEWARYQAVCGEIDQEIFVPELVGQNTLCPHQDYVYFNFPTQEELEIWATHKANAEQAVAALAQLPVFPDLCARLNQAQELKSAKEYASVFVLLEHFGLKVEKSAMKRLAFRTKLPKFSMEEAEIALQFLLSGELLSEEEQEAVKHVLNEHNVYNKRKVELVLTDKLKRTLLSSVGKLNSITEIVRSETAAMGENLRMLVLTDYIKKETLSKAVGAESFQSVNVVSIFETIRRVGTGAKIGVLSGTLVILPKSIDLSEIKHRSEDIPGTDYCVVEIPGATHRAVNFVGDLFTSGKLQILIGTKSLLGEGWDSPCINSLILASFVGSYVLSNQMRGRAIRINKKDPSKVANIWHLVTVEPEYLFQEGALKQTAAKITYNKNQLISYDLDVLKRRFDAFMGPNYTTGAIESGMDRITAIQPPYDQKGVAAINSSMLQLSAQRNAVAEQWKNQVLDPNFSVAVKTQAPREVQLPIPALNGLSSLLGGSTGALLALGGVYQLLTGNIGFAIGLAVAAFSMAKPSIPAIIGRFSHSSPEKSIRSIARAVCQTLTDCGLIESNVEILVSEDADDGNISILLQNATTREENVFHSAMTEIFSPIEEPRYILISKSGKRKYNCRLSFACPAVLSKKKEHAQLLAKNLSSTAGTFEAVYAQREDGRKLLLQCRQESYIAENQQSLKSKYTLSH